MEISQEDRNKAVIETLITWVYQSSIGIIGRSEAEWLLSALAGSKDEELKTLTAPEKTNGNQ